ncbi:hypothetical protein Tco_1575639 [Tanacetum coccineum]
MSIMESSSASTGGGGGADQHHVSNNNIKGVVTHGGRYVQYNVYGNLFEVSRKYVPPIRPVGRGAYGIVCYPGITVTISDPGHTRDVYLVRFEPETSCEDIRVLTTTTP